MNSLRESGCVEIAPGIYSEWLRDSRILTYLLQNPELDSIEIYINHNVKAIEEWPANQTYLALYEAHFDFTITPYLYRRSREIAQVTHDRWLKGRSAVVVHTRVIAQIANVMLRLFSNYSPHIERRMFYDRDEALEWLSELL